MSLPDTTTDPPSESNSIQPLPQTALSLWVGGALSTREVLGNVPEGQFGLVGLRYNRLLAPSASTADGSTLTYTADLFPVMFLSIPREAMPEPESTGQGDGSDSKSVQQGLDTYGIGANPAGLRITFGPAQRVHPFIAGSAGFVYFLRSMPDERGKHLNFTFDVGVGMQVVLSARTTLILGYRFQHLSNGFRGEINPGVDANLFYFGITTSQ